MKQLTVISSLLLMLATTQASFADPLYSVTPVNFETTGVLLNNQGQYVVPAYNGAYLVNGYGPNAGQATPISIPGATAINPLGLNDSGQVVGAYASPSGVATFLYSNGQTTNLSAAAGMQTESGIFPEQAGVPISAGGLAINNSGVVAGALVPPGDPYTSFLGNNLGTYSQGAVTNLGLPPAGTDAFAAGTPHGITYVAMNNSGQIVVMDTQGNPPALYTNGHFVSLQNQSFQGFVIASAINNNGEVVGTARGPQMELAAIYSNGIWKTIGSLGGGRSDAFGINDSGAVVGWSTTSSGVLHAFLYQNGTMTDLNSLLPASLSGITLFGASSINNLGQIVAFGGTTLGGQMQDYLLTPPGVAPLAMVTNLPEPGTLTFFALTMGGFGIRQALKRTRRPSRSVVAI
jgi:probable HAF family extracellular repeat protein